MARDLLPAIQAALAGTYVIERELGRGGAARVFLARGADGVPVALKVLRPELALTITADRFLREIRLVSALHHRHIAPVLATGKSEWLLYYTMPYIEGPTLAGAIASRGRLPVSETIQLGAQLLEALAYAHGEGIVHRDVKPENIVLGADGPVLLDFGIARAIATSGNDSLTKSGMAVGTCAYMSPEQISAEPIDQRADVYAVGCVLFECLAGASPFKHSNDNVTIQLHLTAPAPDVRTRAPGTPAALAGTIARALKKLPADRWQSADAMRNALLAGP